MSINRIGSTKDGLVFIVIDGDFDGKPFQSVTQMVPSLAHKVAQAIGQASQDAEKNKNVIDSPTIN